MLMTKVNYDNSEQLASDISKYWSRTKKKLNVRHLEIAWSMIQTEAQYYMNMPGNYNFFLNGLSLSPQFSCVVLERERTVLWRDFHGIKIKDSGL